MISRPRPSLVYGGGKKIGYKYIPPAATQFVFIGDSLIAGLGGTTTSGNGITGMFERVQFYTDWFRQKRQVAYTVVNKGIGGQSTTQILARYAADVIALAPLYAVNEGGVNDYIGGQAKATFLANRIAMMEADATAGIQSLEYLIGPWTAGTDGQMAEIDDWNASLLAEIAAFPMAIPVNPSTYIGQYRPSGPLGNLWDIRPEYLYSGVHPNELGYGQMARAGYDAL